MINKFLFLDIDGVLNHEDWFKKAYKDNITFAQFWYDPECVKRVCEIVERTNCSIVVSSCHRLDKNIGETFKEVGLPNIYGTTPVLWGLGRGEEIKSYISERNRKFSCDSVYCILDDDNDILEEQKPYFIRTAWDWNDEEQALINGGLGLTESVKERAIKILNRCNSLTSKKIENKCS